MKKVAVLFFLLVLLTGCSGAEKELDRGMALRSKLLQAEQVRFKTEITADYGDKAYAFAMDCQADNQGNVSFTVTAPETIAGITGKICEEGGQLTFDETALHVELLTDDQLSPLSAPWIFLRTLRSGYLTSAGMDGEYLRLTIDDSYEEDALQLDIWLGAGDIPERAEVIYDGRGILTLLVTNFEIV